ncbi:MAG: potassium-transporting ATPase subunit KdpB [Lachnospiraceae bacterium]|nr:potassium-transporting ATPase subunit KdpB [Lachnospiraceae bacterium]
MEKTERTKFITQDILKSSVIGSFQKLDPRYMVKNPVMFVVEIGFFITLILTVFPTLFGGSENYRIYNGIVTAVLFVTVLFANFAESVAEGRGKAQAASLKKTKKDTKARILLADGEEKMINASELKKGDVVLVKMGEVIPNDGEVIEGIASVDESAITGESAPVTRESGGDFSSVTGGTTVVSDWLKIRIVAEPGKSFLDKMISLVEGASRQKTPNEIALNTLLIVLTLIFLIVVVTLYPFAHYLGADIPISWAIALMVCLIPTTIGGLLSAIGIAGMDRVTRFNVIAMSGKAVEACGDVDTMILDKTGTITFGNRLAADFYPVAGVEKEDLIYYSVLSSLLDGTPEGKSTVELGEKMGCRVDRKLLGEMEFVEFTAQTKMSGADLKDGTIIRKGAGEAIKTFVKEAGGTIPQDLEKIVTEVSNLGGTPLVVCADKKIYGVIYLKDTVKPGLVERFARLREIGIKTIMCTGDNPLTAATIAKEAGVDGFIAECKPEDKIEAIKKEQAEGKLVAMTGDGTNDAPALAQADVGLAMNSGTQAAKEAANMVDLDSDPTKVLEVVEIGKQLLITRGSLTTFSIANDIAKYFAIIPAMFTIVLPQMQILNIMHLATPASAILSALIFNAIIIPSLIPIAMKGVKYKPMKAEKLLLRNMGIYGVGGIIVPFVGIKLIDLIIAPFLHAIGI